MQPQPRYQPGDKIGGRFQVHEVKMGGMGEVYLCLDLEGMYPYALKTFQQRYWKNPRILRRAFEKEVATWVALEKHPNIVRCFFMDIIDNQPFMWLEWIMGEEGWGGDLRGWLRHSPLDLRLSLEIAIDVCRGLAFAQEKNPGLVHRDLKPENVLIAQGGLAKVTDFGLAEIVNQTEMDLEVAPMESADRQSIIGRRGIAGTPAYMAPEQWRGEDLDERTDIYALGCILYEMLSGESAFLVDYTPSTPDQVQEWLSAMEAIHERGFVFNLRERLPEKIKDMVSRCLDREITGRPDNLADLMVELTDFYQRQFDQEPPRRSERGEFNAIDFHARGATYARLKQHKQAMADFNQAIELEPNFASVYSDRGAVYHELQQYDQAIMDYNRAIDLNPDLVQVYLNRGHAYSELEQFELAIVDYNRAIVLSPNYAEAYFNRGNFYCILQQHDKALKDFTRVVELKPNDAEAYYNRANTYHDLQHHGKALADYNRAVELDPTDAKKYSNRGLIYYELQQNEQALADYTRAIELDPNYAEAYFNRGITYSDVQRYKKALADFNKAIALDTDFPQAYNNRGSVYHKLQQHEQALANFNRAIELDPESAQAYFNRANTFTNMRQYKEALGDYTRAIVLDPNYTEAYFNRGNAYRILEQYDEALADFFQVSELDPNYAQAYSNLGVLFYNQGKYQKALPQFEKADQLGLASGAHNAFIVRKKLGIQMPEINPTHQALETFLDADSFQAMQEAVANHPLLAIASFINYIQELTQKMPSNQQQALNVRIAWLLQIASERNQME